MLFHPGFSTSEIVDDIAGRGFGLNIVRTHVDRVQGEIEIRTHPGKGTEFIIKLPLTLTIMNALLVQVIDDVFAIPTIAIEKTFDIWPEELEYLGKIPIVVVENTLLPLIELHQLLLSSDPGKSGEYPPCNVLEDRSRKRHVCLPRSRTHPYTSLHSAPDVPTYRSCGIPGRWPTTA